MFGGDGHLQELVQRVQPILALTLHDPSLQVVVLREGAAVDTRSAVGEFGSSSGVRHEERSAGGVFVVGGLHGGSDHHVLRRLVLAAATVPHPARAEDCSRLVELWTVCRSRLDPVDRGCRRSPVTFEVLSGYLGDSTLSAVTFYITPHCSIQQYSS